MPSMTLVSGVAGTKSMARLKSFVEARSSPPVTTTVKLFGPDALGRPLIIPSLLRLRPDGKLLEPNDQV